MKREELLQRFQEEVRQDIEDYRILFMKQLMKEVPRLNDLIMEQLEKVKEEILKIKKENIMFLHFSVLKTDVLQRNYNVLVQVQNEQWHLDKHPVEMSFQIDFLFENLSALWDLLLQKSKVYVDKINQYDIREIIFGELDIYCSNIAHILRYALKDLENSAVFKEVPLQQFWAVRWGQYRDQSEIILQVDREKKNQKKWNKALIQTKKQEDRMVFSGWYQAALKGSVCEGKSMQFITFEECDLENMVFQNCDLSAAVFRRCRLKGCRFIQCTMFDSDFQDTQLEETDFEQSDLTNAVFEPDNIMQITLDQQQFQSVRLREKEA